MPAAHAQVPSRETLTNVQVGRAFAAFLVVLVHTRLILSMAGAAGHWADFGNAGVDIFFVISGFIMAYVTGQRETSAGSFLKARVIRVVPLYWLITAAVAAAAGIVPTLFDNTEARADYILKSLLFVPFLRRDGTAQPIVFVGWTLNYEMFFYVVFAAALLLRKRSRTIAAVLTVLAGLTLVGRIVPLADPVAKFYTSPMLLEFLFGVVLAEGLRFAPRTASRNVRWAVAALVPAMIGLMAYLSLYWAVMHRAVIFGIPALVLVASILLLERWGWRVKSGLLTKLGDASYALYLTHAFVAKALTKVAVKLHPSAAVAAAIELVAFVIIAAVAVAVYELVEAPMTRVLRRWSAPRALPGVTPASA